MARLRHANELCECLLSGILRKSRFGAVKAVADPNRKSGANHSVDDLGPVRLLARRILLDGLLAAVLVDRMDGLMPEDRP
jgi:hypothetical protein